MAPESTYQLYTLHGCCHGEWLPLVFTLLLNKFEATYTEMFGAICDSLTSAFGDTGCHHTFVIDFERVAINPIHAVFLQATMKGCTFHFRQAPFHRIKQEGLLCSVTTKKTLSSERGWDEWCHWPSYQSLLYTTRVELAVRTTTFHQCRTQLEKACSFPPTTWTEHGSTVTFSPVCGATSSTGTSYN